MSRSNTDTLNFSSSRKRPRTRLPKLRRRKHPKLQIFCNQKSSLPASVSQLAMKTLVLKDQPVVAFSLYPDESCGLPLSPPTTSNISLLSCPTPDLMGQVPFQRQFWAWVLGFSGCHGQQLCITAWECNAGIWIKRREFLVTGEKEKTLQKRHITKYSEENLDAGQISL